MPRPVIWVRNSVASPVPSSCNAWGRQDRVCTVVEIKTTVPTTYALSWLTKALPIIYGPRLMPVHRALYLHVDEVASHISYKNIDSCPGSPESKRRHEL
jgi:hypothetical protein